VTVAVFVTAVPVLSVVLIWAGWTAVQLLQVRPVQLVDLLTMFIPVLIIL
jgi:hypothetical protein